MISRDTIHFFNNKRGTYFAETNSRFTYVTVILSLHCVCNFNAYNLFSRDGTSTTVLEISLQFLRRPEQPTYFSIVVFEIEHKNQYC